VQDAAHALPGLIHLLNTSYLALHLAGTVAALLWLHRRRPAAFPLVRTTLVLSSGLALVGYLVYPTAPPRMAGIRIADTVSGGHIDLNSGLVSSLYNPYAAVPSIHFGYALVVGASLLRYGRRRTMCLVGAAYPLLVMFVIVATGNHFLFDALAGAAVAGVAAGVALMATRPTSGRSSHPTPRPARLRAGPKGAGRLAIHDGSCPCKWRFRSVDLTLTSEPLQPTRRRSVPFRATPASVVRGPSSRDRTRWPPRR
jgi:PAP2 superfamily